MGSIARSTEDPEAGALVTRGDRTLLSHGRHQESVDGSEVLTATGIVKTYTRGVWPRRRRLEVLRRTGDLYATDLDDVVDQLLAEGDATTPDARVRLVAFAGHGHSSTEFTVLLGDAASFIRSHLHGHRDLYRVTRFSDPVVAMLALFEKLD